MYHKYNSVNIQCDLCCMQHPIGATTTTVTVIVAVSAVGVVVFRTCKWVHSVICLECSRLFLSHSVPFTYSLQAVCFTFFFVGMFTSGRSGLLYLAPAVTYERKLTLPTNVAFTSLNMWIFTMGETICIFRCFLICLSYMPLSSSIKSLPATAIPMATDFNLSVAIIYNESKCKMIRWTNI